MTSSLIYGKNENNRIPAILLAADRETGLAHKPILSQLAILALGMAVFCLPKPAIAGTYIDKGMVVIDLENGIEWLKCSIGQQWDEENCIGDILRLPQEAMGQVVAQANEKLGGKWRLPSRKELESLVCEECEGVKITAETFPNTVGEPYWTGETNSFPPNAYWSVNFYNGNSFGRFPGYKELAVRLVRDR